MTAGSVVEWVCQDCDGIWTCARRPAAPRRVGDQTIAWNQQSLGMGRGNGRVIAARSNRLIVVATVSHQTDPESMKKPPKPTWTATISVTKKALARAER